jgi:uncharacterized protein (DUF1330 family)
MTAYVIAIYDIVDRDAYQAYPPGVVPLLQKHGAEVLVADYNARALEGDTRSVCVVLKFKSEAKALAWYNDPEYVPVRKIRLESSDNGSLFLASAFVPPGT